MQIPIEKLNSETLRRIVEEYISREGTDYGLHGSELETKVDQVLRQLKRGEAVLCYDDASESCQIIGKEAWQRLQKTGLGNDATVYEQGP